MGSDSGSECQWGSESEWVLASGLVFFFKQKTAYEIKPGDQILVNQVFQVRDNVDVVGTSKGRGFAGLVKRHHFRGGAATHGSMFHRAPGSIGASAFPSRVLPGMRAAGHMGNARVTVRKLQVVRIMDQENLLLVKGAVPGRNGGYVIIRKS